MGMGILEQVQGFRNREKMWIWEQEQEWGFRNRERMWIWEQRGGFRNWDGDFGTGTGMGIWEQGEDVNLRTGMRIWQLGWNLGTGVGISPQKDGRMWMAGKAPGEDGRSHRDFSKI